MTLNTGRPRKNHVCYVNLIHTIYIHIIYTGKGTLISDLYTDWRMSSQIVLSLMEPYLNMSYSSPK